MSTPPDRALEVGKAAEYIVCADLILAGYRAFLSDQGCPYDIVVDVGNRLLRVQVKATAAPRPVAGKLSRGPSYQFHCRRSGNKSSRIIGNDVFDILALVALDIRTVAYIAISDRVLQTIHLRTTDNLTPHANRSRGCIDSYPFEHALCDILEKTR